MWFILLITLACILSLLPSTIALNLIPTGPAAAELPVTPKDWTATSHATKFVFRSHQFDLTFLSAIEFSRLGKTARLHLVYAQMPADVAPREEVAVQMERAALLGIGVTVVDVAHAIKLGTTTS